MAQPNGKCGNSMKQYKFLELLDDTNYYKNISLFIERKRIKFKNLVVVGLGGSFVAAKAILDIIKPNNTNVRFLYFLDEISIRSSLQGLQNEDTFFLFVSKSGKTVEVISIYEIITQYGFNNFVFLTQEIEKNQLVGIAKNGNYEILKHEDVSGRFSFTSNVFFIPVLFAGLNVVKLLNGFRKPIQFTNTEIILSKAFNILMFYDVRFEFFGHWYCQIFAESLGKNGFDCIPISNIGTRDQHSILEYYLNNPRNKFITFITKNISDFSMNVPLNHIVESSNKTLAIQEIKDIELQATKQICDKQNLQSQIIRLEMFDEYNIASLMMGLTLQVIEIAEKLQINPFIQEMVEKRKKISYAMLSKTCKV